MTLSQKSVEQRDSRQTTETELLKSLYLLHHIIIRQDKQITELCVVYNCSKAAFQALLHTLKLKITLEI